MRRIPSVLIFSLFVGTLSYSIGCGDPSLVKQKEGGVTNQGKSDNNSNSNNSNNGTTGNVDSNNNTQVDNSCTPFKAMNGASKTSTVTYEAFSTSDTAKHWPESQKPTFSTDSDGVTKLLLSAGYKIGVLDASLKHQYYYRFLDFDSNKILDISDEEGFVSNKEWDVSFKNFTIYINGLTFKGGRKVYMVKETPGKDFGAFTLADAKAIPAAQFVSTDVVDKDTCKLVMIDSSGMGYFQPHTAFVELNKTKPLGMPYDYSMDDHVPVARPGYFYVIKDDKVADWFVKFKIADVQYDEATNYTKYLFWYKKL